jgi:ABC-type multidrug transport system fused ATPase/permease subunit
MLPEGYETVIQGNAGPLERRTGTTALAIATRAALRPSSLLILDEATSSVDHPTEKRDPTCLIGLMENTGRPFDRP